MYILNSSAFFQNIENDELADLKQTVTETCGKKFRRIDRFIQLALIGSHKCTANHTLDDNTGLYLGSGEGPKSNIHKSLELVYKENEPLMPLNFINMVSNASSFYVAKSLDIRGANIFASDRNFAFNRALKLAELDINSHILNMALVGCVDECSKPLAIQRELLGAGNNEMIAEASYWLLLSRNKNEAIAKITHNQHYADIDTAAQTLKTQISSHNTLIALGENIGSKEATLFEQLPAQCWDYQKDIAISKNHTGYAITHFLSQTSYSNNKTLIHLSKDEFQNCNVLAIERLPA